jgi:type I restriction enzyme S subunit
MESMVLKMRKMKDSGIEWIGEIPEGWELTKVKRIFDIGRGRVISQQELTSVGYPVYSSQTKNNGCLGYISTYDFDKSQLTWTTDGVNAGTVFLREGKHNCTNVCGTLAPKNDTNDLRYLKYALEYIAFYHKRADINGFKIMNNEMAEIELLLPPLFEQQNIANYLDFKCSQTQSILEQSLFSIEEYKKLKQAVITQAVTKGVRGEREMKDSGVEWIGEIPKEWVCEKIKYATSISRGLFNHRPRNDERYYNGKYPFIQTGDVANATKYIVSYSQTLNELGKSVSKDFPKGTLTMTIAANVGDVAILNFDAYFPDSVVGFVPNKNIRTLYLFYVFSAMKDEFIRTAIKSTQLNLNIDRVKETFIPVTLNVNEQCEIENYLESKCAEIDGLIAKKEQLVKELESYKKSLIYEVVTGKREV